MGKRYTATAVQKDEHLIRCSLYIDINMVRAGAVKHPRQWKHGGYNEIVNPKQRYRLIDHASLRRLTDFDNNDSLTAQYKSWISNTLQKGNLSRDDIWTSDVAVGDESFGQITVSETIPHWGQSTGFCGHICLHLSVLCRSDNHQ